METKTKNHNLERGKKKNQAEVTHHGGKQKFQKGSKYVQSNRATFFFFLVVSISREVEKKYCKSSVFILYKGKYF